MVYFSSFENYRGHKGVSISTRTPETFVGGSVRAFVPSKKAVRNFRQNGNRYSYQSSYLNQLENLSRKKEFEKIMKYVDGKVLLTTTKEFKASHRYYLYEFLRRKGYEVQEL